MRNARGRLLHVHEKVAFKNELALFVALRWFIGSIIFPAYLLSTLAAIDVSNSMVSGGHLTVTGPTLYNVYNSVEEIRSPVLPVKCPRDHGMNSR